MLEVISPNPVWSGSDVHAAGVTKHFNSFCVSVGLSACLQSVTLLKGKVRPNDFVQKALEVRSVFDNVGLWNVGSCELVYNIVFTSLGGATTGCGS